MRTLLLVVGLLLASFRVEAQGASPTAAQKYEHVIKDALAEYAASHFEEARVLFVQAHGLDPNARTLRGIGMAEFELRNYPRAIAFLEDALQSARRPLEGDLRARTAELLARARSFTGRVTLRVQPPSASVEVDGAPIDDSGLLWLGMGEHKLAVSAEGHRSETRTIRIRGGDELAVHIDLAAIASLAAPAAKPASPANASAAQQPADRPRNRRWVWATVGVVAAAGAAVGLAFALKPSPQVGAEPGDLGIVVQTLGVAR
ncbi:MAG: hypothetical protein RL385_578 [Pseudomonadota bacterium]|jgi:tetratricopeptide (TPR) repeat protein